MILLSMPSSCSGGMASSGMWPHFTARALAMSSARSWWGMSHTGASLVGPAAGR